MLNRRAWLRIQGGAGLSALTLSRPSLAREVAKLASAGAGFGRARSVVLVYTSGGQSQLETWDPKPHAPESIRGKFRAIQTAVPGTLVGEHMPRLARLADRYAILRALSHEDIDHGSAGYLALTGRPHPQLSSNPPPRPTDAPTYGAVLSKTRPLGRFPYEAVHVNGPALVPEEIGPGQNGGFLGRRHEPLTLGDSAGATDALSAFLPRIEISAARWTARETLRNSIASGPSFVESATTGAAYSDMDHLYRMAFELLSKPECRQAFDLSEESPATLDRYGRNPSGRACVLARRLVEAGVPWITVIWNRSNRGQDRSPFDTDAYGWDTHNDIFEALETRLLPRFDLAFSALLEDLATRGLLDTTLVVCLGEFGRAPRVALEPNFAGATPGRKHWANAYSAVMAGAGITPGAVYGETDRFAAQPRAGRVGPWDVAATMFSALGIDPASEYLDEQGRPYAVSLGRAITGLYA